MELDYGMLFGLSVVGMVITFTEWKTIKKDKTVARILVLNIPLIILIYQFWCNL